ncbi:hemolysin secretion/activation protein ShlB/FhaC/HecB [compost metagenome]
MVAMHKQWLAVLLSLFLVSPSFAQTAPGSVLLPGDRELIRERQQRLLDEQRQRLDELQQLPGRAAPAEPADAAGDEPCFAIRRIRLTGAELIPEWRRRGLLAPFENQCLGSSRLNELLKVITRYYLDRGYVTSRAYLPQQDLSDGELEVLVLAGRLAGLDGSALASERELAMTFPGRVGERLNLRELEQMVDQLGRLPSRQAQIELLPGQIAGGSRVQVKGQDARPWRVNLSRDNSGEDSTGEQQWGAALSWDSPLGLADQLSLRGGGDTLSDHWRHSANQGLFYSLPRGWWTFSYAYNQSYYRTRGEANGFPFGMDGESKTHQLRAERVLHRDAVSKTAASLGLAHLRTRNYLEDSLIDVSSQRLSEGQLGVNHGRRIGSAFVNLDLGWQRGLGALDAQSNGDPHGAQPVARYNKYTLTLSYLQPFTLGGESFSFDSLAYGQRSEDVLFSPQRISLGGLSSVRGFKEQSLSGDSGGYWRNQLRWRRPVEWQALRPFVHEYSLAFAYDLGVIEGGEHNPALHGRLSGNAIELTAQGRHLAASVTFARSLERPDAIARQEHPVYFSLNLTF